MGATPDKAAVPPVSAPIGVIALSGCGSWKGAAAALYL